MSSASNSPRSPVNRNISASPNSSVPAHNVFPFDNIIFSSNFDNGNLGRVERVPNRPYEFKVWTAPDNMGTEYQSKHCAWFHFSVVGLPMGCVLRIQLVNASNHSGLYKHDMRPVYRSNSTNQKWVRIRSSVRFIKDGDSAQLYFEHSIDSDNDKIFFAFTYPYSYSQLQSELADYDMHLNRMDAPGSIFYQRELLTHSCDKRRLDMLTISSVDGASPTEKETLFPGLFPEILSPLQSNRPPVFPNKEVIIVSARVHPGEVPAQHTFKGVLSLLMDPDDQTARELRSRYVFKLIPMLNPDGVYRGHFRMDQHGHNLNRYYNSPDPVLQPTIFAAKTLLDYYSQTGRLSMYLDMHAHASKRGCFIYGNVLDQVEDQIQNQLYCKLISMNSAHFDYEGCLFSREHMFRTDPGDQAKGLTAEGSGRVHTYLAYGLVHSYTLECNYNTSRIGNEVAPPEQELEGQNVTPASTFTTNPEKYTPSSWAGVGRACVVAMIDIRGQNPCSRIPKSKFKTLDRVRNAVVMEVRNRKEYQGKQMSRERRRSIADKKLTGSSATQSDEFVWRRVVDGYEVSSSGARSGMNSARSSSASLSLAAAAAAAIEHQKNSNESSKNNSNSNNNNGSSGASYLFIPAGKEKRRKTVTNTSSAVSQNVIEEISSAIVSGIALDSMGTDATSVKTSCNNTKSHTLPLFSAEPHSPNRSLVETDISNTKDKYQQLERLILESQSVRATGHKTSSPPQQKDAASVASDDISISDTGMISSPSKILRGPLIGNTAQQMQQYFQSLHSTSPGAEAANNSPQSSLHKSSRTRSADALKNAKRDRNAGAVSHNSNVSVEVLVPSSSSSTEQSNNRDASTGRPGIRYASPYNNNIYDQNSSAADANRNSKSSESSRLGVGASIRDLIRDQSIQKLIKLSTQPQPSVAPSAPVNNPANNSSGTGSRRGSNVGQMPPLSSKDNRKILGKTLHAAGVALLMNNSGALTNSDGSSPDNCGNSVLSVQGMNASSRNSSNVSLNNSNPDSQASIR